jgi:hypothetical protein
MIGHLLDARTLDGLNFGQDGIPAAYRPGQATALLATFACLRTLLLATVEHYKTYTTIIGGSARNLYTRASGAM